MIECGRRGSAASSLRSISPFMIGSVRSQRNAPSHRLPHEARSTRSELSSDRFMKSATTCGRKSPIFIDYKVIGARPVLPFSARNRHRPPSDHTRNGRIWSASRRRDAPKSFFQRQLSSRRRANMRLVAGHRLGECQSEHELFQVGTLTVLGICSRFSLARRRRSQQSANSFIAFRSSGSDISSARRKHSAARRW